MPFTSGTATDYHDLLDDLRTWLVSQGWTELAWDAPSSLTDNGFLNIRGDGAGVDKQTFINIETVNDVTQSAYAWRISGATSWSGSALWGTQANESPRPYFNLWASTIDYWFYCNDRRFIVVAKTSTTYTSCYAGFFLPWSTPDQFPFPLYIGADYPLLKTWNFANAARRFCVDPGGDAALGQAGAWVRSPEGIWTPVINHQYSSNNDNHYTRPNTVAFTVPYTAHSIGSNSNTDWTPNGLDQTVATAQSERIILPISIERRAAQPLGVLDGVFCPIGSGLTVEQAITADSRDFMAVQNMNRNSANDFFLVEEVL